MAVMQHSACDDYVTNLHMAFECGAIPLIVQVDGTPDYASLFGRFPHINASRPSWLRVVARIMRSDAYYASFLRDGMHAGNASLPQPWMRDWKRTRHCDWHDLKARVARPAARNGRRIAFPACKQCAGEQWPGRRVCTDVPDERNPRSVHECNHRVTRAEERNASVHASRWCGFDS